MRMQCWFQCNRHSKILDCSDNAPKFYRVDRDGVLLRYAVDLFKKHRWSEMIQTVDTTGKFENSHEKIYRAMFDRSAYFSVSIIPNGDEYRLTISTDGII